MQARYAARPRAPTASCPRTGESSRPWSWPCLLVVLLVVVAIAQGIGDPSVPSGDVAVVEDAPDGHITTEEFQASLEQAAAAQGAKEVPPPANPQYAALRDSAMTDRAAGALGARRGLRARDHRLRQRDLEPAGSDHPAGLRRPKAVPAVPEAGSFHGRAGARAGRASAAERRDPEAGPPARTPTVSESEIEDFYEANQVQFQQPETRDVRQIVNKDQAKVEQAKALLEQDDSPASWKKVAARFSTEDATKDSGGLVEGVTAGQSEPVIEEADLLRRRGRARRSVQGADRTTT